MFSMLVVRSRVPSHLVSGCGTSLTSLPSSVVLPTAQDVQEIQKNLVILVSRILCRYIKALSPFAGIIPLYGMPFVTTIPWTRPRVESSRPGVQSSRPRVQSSQPGVETAGLVSFPDVRIWERVDLIYSHTVWERARTSSEYGNAAVRSLGMASIF